MNPTSVFCIPGLGTDERIFSRLNIGPWKALAWLPPLAEESLADYAQRMWQQIPATDNPPILIGVSFGGMIVQEMAQIQPVQKVILISSIKSSREKPITFRAMKHIPLYQLSKGSWRYRWLPYWAPLVGITDKGEIQLLQDMFQRFDDGYRMWAIRQVCTWKGAAPTDLPVLHIHGTRDQIFPYSRIRGAIRIKKGDHFMVYRKAGVISEVIRRHLDSC